MQILKISAVTAFFLGFSGITLVCAQVQVERISTTERSDGQGFVIRYHLTQMVDSFSVMQTRADRIWVELLSDEMEYMETVPVTGGEIIRNLTFFRIPGGVGAEIDIIENYDFEVDAYPDANGKDLLVALQGPLPDGLRAETEEPASERARPVEEEAPEEENGDPEESLTEPAERRAQEARTGSGWFRGWRVSPGVMTGISASHPSGSDFTKGFRRGTTIGLSLDLYMPYLLAERIPTGLETGIFYTQNGFRNPDPDFLNGRSIEFDYIEIPVLATFRYEIHENVIPRLLAGPYLGFTASAERVRNDGSRRDLDDFTNKAVIGGSIGAGLDIRIGQIVLTGQVRGAISFSNVLNNRFEHEEVGHFRHRFLAAMAGVRF